jgi:hypothetical protein
MAWVYVDLNAEGYDDFSGNRETFEVHAQHPRNIITTEPSTSPRTPSHVLLAAGCEMLPFSLSLH